jgi:monofunctional biosynthetic peptidoglycan transglycosylase
MKRLKLPKRVKRALGRGLLGATAVGFAYLAYAYLLLPDVRPLRVSNPSMTAFMELRGREARDRGRSPRRVQRWVKYNRLSRDLTRAVLVTEDDAFWQHEGVDFLQVRASLKIDWMRGNFARGASTITQQLAKNLYLSPSKSPMRKLRELIIARRLEAELEKARILEIYLNVIEWGDGVYGAEAAARTYFGTSASALGPEESALLAASIINPRVLNPARPTPGLLRRQQMILRRLGSVQPPAPPAASPPVEADQPTGDPVAPIAPVEPSEEPIEPILPPEEPLAPPAEPHVAPAETAAERGLRAKG